MLSHDGTNALRVFDNGKFVHNMGCYFQDGQTQPALLADHLLCKSIDKQGTADDQRFNSGVMLKGLQNEAQPFDVIQAGLVADFPPSQAVDALNERMLKVCDDGDVLGKAAVVAARCLMLR